MPMSPAFDGGGEGNWRNWGIGKGGEKEGEEVKNDRGRRSLPKQKFTITPLLVAMI